MIIITGPGRSGTSVVARLYLELGFDPGGRWNVSINAGLEADDVVRANRGIIRDLELGTLGPPREAAQPPRRISQLWKRIVPAPLHERVRSMLYRLPSMSSREAGFLRWDRFDELVDSQGSALHDIGGSHEVVKDPRFCWTLGVWAAAGVEIEQVLVCVRSLDAMVQSRGAAGHLRFRSEESAKDSFVYGLGLCITALHEYRLPHVIIRFPDFLEDPEQLFATLKFPKPVSRDQFLEVAARVIRPDLVHQRR